MCIALKKKKKGEEKSETEKRDDVRSGLVNTLETGYNIPAVA